MIVFDTETDGLSRPEPVPLDSQAHIIEFAAIKLDDKTLKERSRISFLCNPGVPLPPETVKITGITEEQLIGVKSFISHYDELTEFFLGERSMASHFLAFDKSMLRFELMRFGREFHFPWPPRQVCTVEASQGIKNHKLSLSDLYLLAKGKDTKEKLPLAAGQYLMHKSLGKCTVLRVEEDGVVVRLDKGGKEGKYKKEMLLKGSAFERAHSAMMDVEKLVECIVWLRKEGHL